MTSVPLTDNLSISRTLVMGLPSLAGAHSHSKDKETRRNLLTLSPGRCWVSPRNSLPVAIDDLLLNSYIPH